MAGMQDDRRTARALAEFRAIVPLDMRPRGSSEWPEPVTQTKAALRSTLAACALKLDLSQPEVAAAIIKEIGNRASLRGPLSGNATLPVETRMALTAGNAYWTVTLATEMKELPDVDVIKALGGSPIPFDAVDSLLLARPYLAASWRSWSDRNQRALLASVFAPVDLVRHLLDASSLRSSSRVREIWDTITSSPVIPKELRDEAFELRSGQWEPERRAIARIAMEATPTLAWPWSPEILDDAPATTLVGLVNWAHRSFTDNIETGARQDYASPVATRAISASLAGRAALTVLGLDVSVDWDFGMGNEYRRFQPALVEATGSIVNAALAAHVWDEEVNHPAKGRFMALRLAHSWGTIDQRAATAHLYLGSNRAAWETFIGLHSSWSGTFGEMLMTAKALS